MNKTLTILLAAGLACLAACKDEEIVVEPEKGLSYHWERLPDFPGAKRWDANYFVLGSQFYMGLGCLNDVWVLDLDKQEWTRLEDFPYNSVADSHCFTVGNTAYMLGTRNEQNCDNRPYVSFSWQFTIENGWMPMDKERSFGYWGSRVNGYAYIIDRPYVLKKDVFMVPGILYEYDTATDTYIHQSDYPVNEYPEYFFGIAGKGYAGFPRRVAELSREMWEYDALTGNWIRIKDFPGAWRTGAACFGLGKRGYMVGGDTSHEFFGGLYSKEVWEYNPETDKWKKVSEIPFKSYRAQAVKINDSTALLILDHNSRNAIWKFKITGQKN